MGDKPENPPAFPLLLPKANSYSAGMTLRDYFATHCPFTLSDAMKMIEGTDTPEDMTDVEFLMNTFAKARWYYADEMLEERVK